MKRLSAACGFFVLSLFSVSEPRAEYSWFYGGADQWGNFASIFGENSKCLIMNLDESQSGYCGHGGDSSGYYWLQFSSNVGLSGFEEPPSWFVAIQSLSTSAHCAYEGKYSFDDGLYYGWGMAYNCFDPSTSPPGLMGTNLSLFYRADHPTTPDNNHDTGYVNVNCRSGSCVTSQGWNSKLGGVTVSRSGVGAYEVVFAGLSADAAYANVQITDICYAGDGFITDCAATLCRPTGTFVSGNSTHVPVRCRTPTEWQDSAFMLLYETYSMTATCETVNCQNDSTYMHGYANRKSYTSTYTAANNRSFFFSQGSPGTPGSPVQVRGYLGAPGTYDVTFPGVVMNMDDGPEPTHIHVTAVDDGSGWSYCNVLELTQSWPPNVGLVAHVQCFGASGQNVAARFYIAMTNDSAQSP